MLKTAPDEGLNHQEWKAFLNEQDFGQAIALGIGRRYPLPRPERAPQLPRSSRWLLGAGYMSSWKVDWRHNPLI